MLPTAGHLDLEEDVDLAELGTIQVVTPIAAPRTAPPTEAELLSGEEFFALSLSEMRRLILAHIKALGLVLKADCLLESEDPRRVMRHWRRTDTAHPIRILTARYATGWPALDWSEVGPEHLAKLIDRREHRVRLGEAIRARYLKEVEPRFVGQTVAIFNRRRLASFWLDVADSQFPLSSIFGELGRPDGWRSENDIKYRKHRA